MRSLIRTTILGGILFLIPLVFLVAVLGKALSWIHKLATPMLNHLPVEHFAGALFVHLLSLFLLLLFCFVAGLVARKQSFANLVDSLEANVLMKLPPYALFKAKTGSVLNPDEQEKLTPVLVRLDDAWQVGFEIEAIEEGKHLVFLPGAPDPWSGSICIVDAERMTRVDTSVKSVNIMMKRLGMGGGKIIQIPATGQAD